MGLGYARPSGPVAAMVGAIIAAIISFSRAGRKNDKAV